RALAAHHARGSGSGKAGQNMASTEYDPHRCAPVLHVFSSRLNSSRKRQSVLSAMIFWGLDFIMPISCRRSDALVRKRRRVYLVTILTSLCFRVCRASILVQGDEGPAQVVRLGHRGTPSVTCRRRSCHLSPPAP